MNNHRNTPCILSNINQKKKTNKIRNLQLFIMSLILVKIV